MENADTRKALSIVEESAMTEGQLYAYERFWQAVVNERVLIEGGYKKGRAEGREEGRAEERLKNARNLKANGIAIDVIANSLGLSQDEIEALNIVQYHYFTLNFSANCSLSALMCRIY